MMRQDNCLNSKLHVINVFRGVSSKSNASLVLKQYKPPKKQQYNFDESTSCFIYKNCIFGLVGAGQMVKQTPC